MEIPFPDTMRAVTLQQFGGVDELSVQRIPVPAIAAHEILLRVEVAGVGEWDAFERAGGYAAMLGQQVQFPYVLGSEGAGTVAAVGSEVTNVQPGDRVYALGFLNAKGGFYAEYVALDAAYVAIIPAHLTTAQAATMAGVGTTAVRGLEDTLQIQRGESLVVFGASGGIGHLAIQLAQHMGARVFAVASGNDGVALAQRLGADGVVDGHSAHVLTSTRAFAPDGFDAALLTAGGAVAEQLIQSVRPAGRIAYPYGIRPEPQTRAESRLTGYYGAPDPDILGRFHQRVETGHVTVHVAQTFDMDHIIAAHRTLATHYLGKLALQVGTSVEC